MTETTKTTQTRDSQVKVALPVIPVPEIEITKNQLIGVLAQQKGHCFMKLFATTDVKMNKGGRANTNYLYGNIVKDSGVHCSVDFEYENAKNNALKREGKTPDFEVQERKWGEHLVVNGRRSRTIIIYEKDFETRVYVQVKVNPEQCDTPVYRYKDTGEELSEKDIEVMKSYLPERKKEDVIVRDYRVDNVKKIHINKAHYILKQ